MTHPPAFDPQSYARWRSTPLGAITEELEVRLVFELAGPLGGRSVLDVGTGDGTYALEAAARGGHVTGVDVEPTMLQAAAERAASGELTVTFARASTETLPFDSASFDLVLAITVLFSLTEPSLAVREMARVLRPGGKLVVGELGRYSLWAASRRIRGWLGSRTWRNADFWSRAELRRCLRDAGLCHHEVRGAVYYPPNGHCARRFGALDPWLSRLQAPGAAFLAIAADKP